jgi:hypothetical protein
MYSCRRKDILLTRRLSFSTDRLPANIVQTSKLSVRGIVYTGSLKFLRAAMELFLALLFDFLEQCLVLGCSDMEIV